MAKQVTEQKTVRSGVAAPYTNGTVTESRLPANEGGVPRRRPRMGLWITLLVLVLAAGGAAYYFHSRTPAAADAATDTAGKGGKHGGHLGADKTRVVTATAATGDMGVYLTGLGSVTPLNTVTVKTRVDGELMKVLYTEGQMVKQGDLLVQLDARPYQAQLAQYQAQQEHDQALLDNAKIDEARYETLWAQNSIPQQTLATQQALVKQDQGTVDSDQALIQATQLNITYCNVTAPISGRVGLRLVDQGNQVHASDTNGLLVIAQIQPITVTFTIPEDNVPDVLPKLNAGQQLPVVAYDRAQKNKLTTGTLLTSDNQIDASTGTLKLKAIFQNQDNALFPNQFVNAKMLVDTKKDVVIIPVAAIQYGTQGTFVFVVDDSDPKAATVSIKKVTVGTIDDDKAEISDGLDEGDTVVTDGVDKLQNGSKVIISNGADGGRHETADAAPAAGS